MRVLPRRLHGILLKQQGLLRGIIYDQGTIVRAYSMIRSVVSRAFGLFFIPTLAIMTMWSAHKADKMVENFILGPEHKRK